MIGRRAVAGRLVPKRIVEDDQIGSILFNPIEIEIERRAGLHRNDVARILTGKRRRRPSCRFEAEQADQGCCVHVQGWIG